MSEHPILTITDMYIPGSYAAITAATEDHQWSALTERLARGERGFRSDARRVGKECLAGRVDHGGRRSR